MREKLRAGKLVLGAGISLSDPAVTEAIAPSVDFVWIDLEHNALTVEKMLGHLIAARAGGCASIVRIPTSDVGWIKRVIDSGAEGIILPRAYSAREVADSDSGRTDLDAERTQRLVGLLHHCPPCDESETAAPSLHEFFAAEEDVLADREIGSEREVLVDGLDA